MKGCGSHQLSIISGLAADTEPGCKAVVGDDIGQAERLADNKDSGDHSSSGSGSECDRVILFGTNFGFESPPENRRIQKLL